MPVFGIASPKNFDDSGIWTMHVVTYKKKLWMFYIGLTLQKYYYQQIGLATSERKDGTSWIRHKPNAVVSADPLYYQVNKGY